LRAQLDAAEREGVATRSHCAARHPWYQITNLETPDLFLPYLNACSPHLVKNAARALCTNAIHRIFLKDGRLANALVTSSYGSLFAFECELLGRHYGGSILKLEPSEAKQLSIHPGLDYIDELLQCESEEERHELVDGVLNRRFAVSRRNMSLLRDGAKLLRQHRMVSKIEQ
jgi:hypothetical protein